ncbi:actin-3-like [Hemiscyllium ocellatum]|uniref:actin-3-like n=1 Tax=Hemiscyllium ocellatum TaxID=170820 RepID=UPI002966F146|nr:actin-3-like [Hemiscyllium ocellatum]
MSKSSPVAPQGPPMCQDPFTDTAAVVMDNGTGYTKAGFAGDDKPRVVVRSLVGIPNQSCEEPGKAPDYYIGAAIPADPWVVKTPVVTNGVVTDWDALEMLWHHVFYQELRVAPEEHAVLLSDAPLSPLANREKAAELLFEGFGVPAMYVAHQSLLSLYSTGRTSGLIVESGLGVSYTAPVHSGYTMPHATFRLDLAGGGLTEYMAKLLEECGNPFSAEEMHVVTNIKETCCYVAQDFNEEMVANENDYLTDYELPDGHIITIGNERFRCPESLFRPEVVGLSAPGLHALALKSLERCPAEHQLELLTNIVLSGGSSMFPGFAERIQSQIGALFPGRAKLGVYASPQRRFSVWIGGSITACLNTFQSMWVSREDYDEKGPSVVQRKCF